MQKAPTELHCDTCTSRAKGVFCDLMSPLLKNIDLAKTTNQYRNHQAIFYEGNRPYGVFCVFDGKIKVFKTDAEGHQHIVRLAGPGDILGYRALLANSNYEATAETIENATICFFDKATFFQILDAHPISTLQILRKLSTELAEAENHSVALAHKSIRERLAELFLIFQKKYGKKSHAGTLLDIHLSREELAELVGTTQESVIRTISDFKQEGLIQLQGKLIIIANTQKLAHVANLEE
jgi:CRP-like cAMP-binding protein